MVEDFFYINACMSNQPSDHHLTTKQNPSTMSQSSYISRRSSSRLGDYAEFTSSSQQDMTEATSATMLTVSSRVASAKVLELANTNDMLEERMSSLYEVLLNPFILFRFCLSLFGIDNILFDIIGG